jgi:GT2 family glycosyltransferase
MNRENGITTFLPAVVSCAGSNCISRLPAPALQILLPGIRFCVLAFSVYFSCVKPFSFIIITYNRPEDTLALVRNIAQLDQATGLLQEIVLVNNRSTTNYTEVEQYVQASPLPFRYVVAPDNLGVARGRNFALQYATAPILILLDDDAELQNRDALLRLQEAFAHKASNIPTNRETAIVSFKVLYYTTLEMQQNTLPHKKYEQYRHKDAFYTYFYAGGAHAILRKVFAETGYYPEDFFYGMEEYDLSYRLLDKGYAIQYNSSIVMLHKESPLGRKPTEQKLKMMWVNKSKVAWRYLPLRYFISTALMWSVEFVRKAGFRPVVIWQAFKEIARVCRTEKRRPVKTDTLEYLRKVDARLWY